MPAPDKKKKLSSFGKNRKPTRVVTTYDEQGNWVATQHQDKMRQMENPLFNKYYNELQVLGNVEAARRGGACTETPAELWSQELALFRTPLPTTLWINDADPLAPEVRQYFESLDASMVEPIPWYPLAGMGWRILADKTEFRKRPEMQALRKYLIRQTALGTISRQEEVSMIPPFLLDIQPTDKCLDMCASPGSKTAQMLVALGRHKVVPMSSNASVFPFDYESEGLVMANELDTKRANMLVHQVKRLRLLFPFALFTNHDARYFPDVMLKTEEDAVEAEAMRFDKILCDVVCSGDGTLRKAPHVFKIWTPKEGMTLQLTQIQIALRACHLLRIGGRLVYSTCSLNPIENEAVVAQIVHRTKGAMKLVDARALLPNLTCAAGMQTWTVTDFRGNVVTAPSATMHEACFPPNTPGGYSSPAVDSLDLGLCMRLFPSHCNGGGFFIAVFDKVEEYRIAKKEEVAAEAEAEAEGSTETAAAVPVVAGKREREPELPLTTTDADVPSSSVLPPGRKPKVTPQFVAAPDSMIETIKTFYEIPQFSSEYLVVRTAHGERELRLTPSSIATIVSKTTRRILAQKTDSLLVVSAGLRAFAFETLNKGWRITSESAVLFAKLMSQSSRVLTVPVGLVQEMIAQGGKLKEMLIESIEDETLRARVEALPLGTVLLRIESPAAVDGVLYSVALRARSRLQLLVDHEDIVGVQLRLGLEPQEEVSAPKEAGEEESSA